MSEFSDDLSKYVPFFSKKIDINSVTICNYYLPMWTNVLDNTSEYDMMISEHTFEWKRGRIHMTSNQIIEKIVEILKKMNERQLNLVLLFVQSLK